ncbi:MAG: aminodeoxychorismate synthase component I [Candidatus Omnitrophota bacterium]
MTKQIPISIVLNALKKCSTFVFLDSSLSDQENRQSLLFINPHKVFSCYKISGIRSCLRKMQQEKEKGNYLAGFLSYEAGYAFHQKLQTEKKYNFPLIWMGVFKKPVVYNHVNGSFLNAPFKLQSIQRKIERKSCKLSNFKLSITKKDYLKNIKRIKELIAAGDTYQVNYTTKLKFDFKGSDFALYQKLRKNQQVGYGALIKSRQFSILSLSPELFFRQTKKHICVRPMKGTMTRGINAQDDIKIRKFLSHDPKNRAENIMIVDLLRNDLGKISQTSSVRTTRLFHVETYKTLLQMTSTVESELKKGISLYDLFSSLHPSGSVTGAPKIHTMEIIKQLEPEDRKIYTGCIGYISPENTAAFNVAIRTILLKGTKGEMGVGGGITYSSCPESEWAECKLKAKFIRQSAFQLIETMRASKKENIFLFNLHLKRLRASAKFFGFAFDLRNIKTALTQRILTLNPDKTYKIRLLLGISGDISIHTSVLSEQEPHTDTPKICISPHRLNHNNMYLYHKTTNRILYNRALKRYKKQGFFDVIFLNLKGEICESAISNIFLKKNGVYYTPPVSCGLLPGVFREYFLTTHKKIAKEKVLHLDDLKNADEIYCTNSVLGMVKVKLVQKSDKTTEG